MSDTQEQFETKLAAAGEALAKLASDRGLSLNDFTEEETIDLLSTIMGEGGGSDGGGAPAAEPKVASAAPVSTGSVGYREPAAVEKVAYVEALAEVMKVAQANGFDLNTAAPAEVHAAVEQMQTIMADPSYATKQAALQEKVAEADALGRVMAHAYVDELSKIAAKTASADNDADDEKKKAEKKAALVRDLRAKVAGEMPAAFAAHIKGKGKGDGDDKDEKEEAEKKAAFEKQAQLRAAEVLIENGINPATGAKFASDAEKIEAGASLILQQKGYVS